MADGLVYDIYSNCQCTIIITDGEKEEIYKNVILEALGPGMVAFKKSLPGVIDEGFGEWSERFDYRVIISPTMRIDIYPEDSIIIN